MKFLALLFLVAATRATTFDCYSNCAGKYLDCRSVSNNTACVVNCHNSGSCSSTSITCPPDQTCTLNCLADGSCKNIAFKPGYPTNSKGPDINCKVSGACSNTVIGAESENFFAVNCMASKACVQTTVRCGTAQVCELHCNPYSGACVQTNFQCETTKNLCYWDCESGSDVCQNGKMQCSSEGKGSPNVCLTSCGIAQSCMGDEQDCTSQNGECYCWDANRVKGKCPGMKVVPAQ